MSFLRELQLKRHEIEDEDRYPYNIPAVRGLDKLALHPGVTYFIGENGSGKSTFIEAIAILAGFNAEGGSKHFNHRFHPSESPLYQHLRLIRNFSREKGGFFLRAETMFNVSTQIIDNHLSEYGWEDLHRKSHGEAFLWLMQNRFRGNGLYVLDEPEAALSPQRQLALLRIIHDLVLQSSQFIIATHSPILMAYPNSTCYLLDQHGVSSTTLEETEHFQVTGDFVNNPQRMLHNLFEE